MPMFPTWGDLSNFVNGTTGGGGNEDDNSSLPSLIARYVAATNNEDISNGGNNSPEGGGHCSSFARASPSSTPPPPFAHPSDSAYDALLEVFPSTLLTNVCGVFGAEGSGKSAFIFEALGIPLPSRAHAHTCSLQGNDTSGTFSPSNLFRSGTSTRSSGSHTATVANNRDSSADQSRNPRSHLRFVKPVSSTLFHSVASHTETSAATTAERGGLASWGAVSAAAPVPLPIGPAFTVCPLLPSKEAAATGFEGDSDANEKAFAEWRRHHCDRFAPADAYKAMARRVGFAGLVPAAFSQNLSEEKGDLLLCDTSITLVDTGAAVSRATDAPRHLSIGSSSAHDRAAAAIRQRLHSTAILEFSHRPSLKEAAEAAASPSGTRSGITSEVANHRIDWSSLPNAVSTDNSKPKAETVNDLQSAKQQRSGWASRWWPWGGQQRGQLSHQPPAVGSTEAPESDATSLSHVHHPPPSLITIDTVAPQVLSGCGRVFYLLPHSHTSRAEMLRRQNRRNALASSLQQWWPKSNVFGDEGGAADERIDIDDAEATAEWFRAAKMASVSEEVACGMRGTAGGVVYFSPPNKIAEGAVPSVGVSSKTFSEQLRQRQLMHEVMGNIFPIYGLLPEGADPLRRRRVAATSAQGNAAASSVPATSPPMVASGTFVDFRSLPSAAPKMEDIVITPSEAARSECDKLFVPFSVETSEISKHGSDGSITEGSMVGRGPDGRQSPLTGAQQKQIKEPLRWGPSPSSAASARNNPHHSPKSLLPSNNSPIVLLLGGDASLIAQAQAPAIPLISEPADPYSLNPQAPTRRPKESPPPMADASSSSSAIPAPNADGVVVVPNSKKNTFFSKHVLSPPPPPPSEVSTNTPSLVTPTLCSIIGGLNMALLRRRVAVSPPPQMLERASPLVSGSVPVFAGARGRGCEGEEADALEERIVAAIGRAQRCHGFASEHRSLFGKME